MRFTAASQFGHKGRPGVDGKYRARRKRRVFRSLSIGCPRRFAVAAAEKAVADPAIKRRFATPGIDPWYKDSAAFTAYVPEEIARIGKVVPEASIKAE